MSLYVIKINDHDLLREVYDRVLMARNKFYCIDNLRSVLYQFKKLIHMLQIIAG